MRTDKSAEQLADWFNRTVRGLSLEWGISSGHEFALVKEAEAYCRGWMIAALSREKTAGSG